MVTELRVVLDQATGIVAYGDGDDYPFIAGSGYIQINEGSTDTTTPAPSIQHTIKNIVLKH